MRRELRVLALLSEPDRRSHDAAPGPRRTRAMVEPVRAITPAPMRPDGRLRCLRRAGRQERQGRAPRNRGDSEIGHARRSGQALTSPLPDHHTLSPRRSTVPITPGACSKPAWSAVAHRSSATIRSRPPPCWCADRCARSRSRPGQRTGLGSSCLQHVAHAAQHCG